MAYFTSIILWIAIAPASPHWLQPLLWFLLAPLPFTVWSLFTQAFLIRKWCLFCCAIVVFLWVNTGISVFFIPFDCIFPVVESLLLALLLLACTMEVVYFSKTGKLADPYSEQRETARIKYDFKTIQGQLSEYQNRTNNVGFVWGNSQTTYEITLYVSIACSYCGAAIKEFKRITETYPDLGCRLIFAVRSDDYEHKSNIIIRHFLNLNKTMDRDDFFNMLDAWYIILNKRLEALQKLYPAQSNLDNKIEMDALYQFSQQTKISYTPAILIKGQLLSQLYSYNDLNGIARTLNAED